MSTLSPQGDSILLVVTYHYVRAQGGTYPGIHPVSPDSLRQQISRLLDAYHGVTPEEAVDFAIGRKPLARNSFLITFDDGLVDHATEARAVLDEFGLKGAFFIPTRPLAKGLAPSVHKIHWLRAHTAPEAFVAELRDALPVEWSGLELNAEDAARASAMHIHDEPDVQKIKFALNFLIPNNVVDQTASKMLARRGLDEAGLCRETFMSSEQIKNLDADGHVIGLHGHNHVPLSSLNTADMQADIETNATVLGGILGRSPDWLSYPYGRPDALPADTRKLCENQRVRLGFSLIPGFNSFGDDATRLKRITPNELGQYLDAS